MDASTLLGLIAGLGLVAFAIFAQHGEMDAFLNGPAFMLVMGGTLAATLVNYPIKSVFAIFKVVKRAFMPQQVDYAAIISKMTELATKVRSKGIVSLESDLPSIEDEFLRDGIELAINERNADRLRSRLQMEISNMERRHTMGQELFFYMGMYAPAFGLMGTVLGLIIMMHSFQTDPNEFAGLGVDVGMKYAQLLRAMGLALVTTFYGVLFANLVFIPIAGKLKRATDEEIMLKDLMVEGIMSLHAKEHPLLLEGKLITFLPARERKVNEDNR
ncbi:MAG: motility protein A [Calditrichaeota bacterium]|nr:motility protein A [Calditrichota bacterium]